MGSCCNSRNEKDGNENFSKSIVNIEKVKEIISNNNNAYIDLRVLHFDKGWRMYQSYTYKSKTSFWLSDIIENEMISLLCSNILSISEEALLHNKNYVFLLSNRQIRQNLIEQYIAATSILVLNEEFIDFIIERSKQTNLSKQEKDEWSNIKKIFEIEENVKIKEKEKEREKDLEKISNFSTSSLKSASKLNKYYCDKNSSSKTVSFVITKEESKEDERTLPSSKKIKGKKHTY